MLKESNSPDKEDIAMTNVLTSLDSAIKAHQRYILKPTSEDLSEAINGYIEALKQNPNLSSAYYRLATLLYNNGQITVQGAIEQCSKAVELDQKDPNAHMYLGYFLSLEKDFDKAKDEFKKALKLNPTTSRTRLILALTMIEKIKAQDYKKTPKDFLSAFYYGLTGSIMTMFDKTSINLALSNLKNDINFVKNTTFASFLEKIQADKKAYNIYLNTVDNSKKSIKLYEKMASIAKKKNRFDIAFDCLNNAVILSNNDPIKIVNAIEFTEQHQTDKTNELIDYYTLLINKYPKLSKAYYELGHLYLKKEEKINALSAFKMALNCDKNNPYYENSLAFAYIQLEQYDSAIEMYKKALEKNPDNEWSAVVAQALAAIYHQVKGNPEAAISMLERALSLTKNKAQVYEAMADIYYDLEELETSVEYYELALEQDNKNPKLYSRLAMSYWEQDYVERSIMYYSKAIELDPTYDIAYNNLGVVYLDGLGDYSRAQKYFSTALEINPDYVLAYFNLARSLEIEGEKVKAAKLYQKALNLNKDKNEINSEIIEQRLHKLFET